ncbi:porin [Melaminivora sp.]
MKKSLIALAVLAASGTAMAQSSVTMFGIVDVGVTHVSATQSATGLSQSGNSSSRLGFRGVEDLGGGLKAGFWLEGAVKPDDGTGAGGGNAGPGFAFMRRSTVSMMGNFGEVRLGRELTAGYVRTSSYDPFGQVGLAAVQGLATARVSNGISYHTPGNLGGFGAMAHYGFGEQTSNSLGRYVGLNAGYNNGPLSVGFAVDKLNGATVAAPDRKTWSLGASYDLGMVKPAFLYSNNKLGAAKDNVIMLALTAPVGPGRVLASFSRYDVKNSVNDSHALSVGYVYDLSKRTALYGTLAHMKNKNGATKNLNATGDIGTVTVAPGESVTGYQVGIRHAF